MPSFIINKQISYVLDSLRSLAALMVVVGHIGSIIYPKLKSSIFLFFTGFGHQAVIIFFVLSGYLVSRSLFIYAPKGYRGFIKYGVDRLTRLYVVLLPALLLTYLVDNITINFFNTNSYFSYIKERLGLSTLIGNIVFLQDILVARYGSNGPLWSLAYEFWYYVTLPIVVLPFFDRRRFVVILSLLLIVIIFKFIPIEIIKYSIIWIIGCALWFIRKPILRDERYSVYLLVIVVLFSGFDFFQQKYIGFLFDVLIAASIGMVINSYQYCKMRGNHYSEVSKLFSDFSYSV